MLYHWAEVAPAVPALVEALPPLLILAGLLFALGCATLIDGFVKGLFGFLQAVASHVPGLGSLLDSALHSAEQAITNALGKAISGIDARIATQLHNLARIVSHLWNQIKRMAELTFDIAKLVSGYAAINDLLRLARRVNHLFQVANHAATVALHKIAALEREFTRSVAHGVYPRLRAVEHAVTKTIPREIKSARALAREAEDGVARLWDRVRSLEQSIGATAIAAAVATALAAVGLDWLGCKDGESRVGRGGCALWDDLGKLLGIAFVAVELGSFEDLLKEAQPLVEPVTKGLADLLDVNL